MPSCNGWVACFARAELIHVDGVAPPVMSTFTSAAFSPGSVRAYPSVSESNLAEMENGMSIRVRGVNKESPFKSTETKEKSAAYMYVATVTDPKAGQEPPQYGVA